ncbi:hypothetical protein PHLCEN_2v703 [Hermanssonia centrifuga]|uniref:Uncharacterized protein n=1 Tax=Hermanssonia centrifuga TaxID=98765 RepID=A0A2R6S5E9_9APHY|nr:hypothetical protein PHLCEN_2v703 [Hermanssonia centrifuga]
MHYPHGETYDLLPIASPHASNSGEGRRFIGIVCPGADLYAVPETSTCSIGVSGSSSPVDRAGKPTRHHSRGREMIEVRPIHE